jgi:hypothetical protein
MRKIRLIILAALMAVSTIAAPAYADSGPGTGGGGGGTISFQTFRMAGVLYTTQTASPLLTAAMQYTLDPSGRAKFVLGYLNLASVPAGTVLTVTAVSDTGTVSNVGSFVTSAQGGSLSIDSSRAPLPGLTLQSTINISANGATVASGRFTLKV